MNCLATILFLGKWGFQLIKYKFSNILMLQKIYIYLAFYSSPLFQTKQDSKESSPRLFDKMLLKLYYKSILKMFKALTRFFKFSKSSKFSKFLKYSKFKPCQIIILEYSYSQNDTIISILLQKITEYVWTFQMWIDTFLQTCPGMS